MFDESFLGQVKRFLVGQPIPSSLAHDQRLSKVTGLAVLSSDPLSSVAYATEEVLRVLMIGGFAAMSLAPTIAVLIAGLLIVVVISYRQTVYAYPLGGGAYRVSKENLGEYAGLSPPRLLIDYTLTVAVSVAAGVAAITSAFPELHLSRVALGLGFVSLLAIANLRGVRESGRLFAVPTYGFIGLILTLIGWGLWRVSSGQPPVPAPVEPLATFDAGTLTTFAVLTAFANGCTAMTGVEAISDGVPAFKPPESKNAAATLTMMAAIAVTMFVGISYLAFSIGAVPSDRDTIVSQIGRAVFGDNTPLYYGLQVVTMAILVLAANTAYADFPRLASIVARDRYMPRQFMNQGDKLAFSNGIFALSVAAGGLIWIFGGDTHQLIPLYMIGVFLSFTLSQSGMFLRSRRGRAVGWQWRAAINGFGALLTFVVLIIVAVTKGPDGAWIVIVLIPVIVAIFLKTKKHYDEVASLLHNQRALLIKGALLFRPNVVVTSVPFHLR